MKAIVYFKYGSPDVLEMREIDMPAIEDDHVLVKVHAASLNPFDWHLTRGVPYFMRAFAGMSKPRNTSLGIDLAGTIEAFGRNVTQFHPGDEVFGQGAGACAEYVGAKADQIAPKPSNLSFEEAAAVPVAATTALQSLRGKGRLHRGQAILVNGAAGGVGTFAVQIAKSLGAEVTGVCSTRNVDMVRSIGADHVLDYLVEDFTRTGQRYDLILDAVGNRSLSDLRRALTPKGTLRLVGGGGDHWLGPMPLLLRALVVSPFVRQRLAPVGAKVSKEDLLVLRQLIEDGKLTPVIDLTFAFGEAAEALRYLEAGHARGKVVITV